VKRRKVKRLIRRDIKGWCFYFGLNEWAIVVTGESADNYCDAVLAGAGAEGLGR